MLKQIILITAIAISCSVAHSQSVEITGHSDPLLKQISPVKEKAEKVISAEEQVKLAATGSRATGSKAALDYTQALNEYLQELNVQVQNPASPELKSALKKEIKTVEKLQSK